MTHKFPPNEPDPPKRVYVAPVLPLDDALRAADAMHRMAEALRNVVASGDRDTMRQLLGAGTPSAQTLQEAADILARAISPMLSEVSA